MTGGRCPVKGVELPSFRTHTTTYYALDFISPIQSPLLTDHLSSLCTLYFILLFKSLSLSCYGSLSSILALSVIVSFCMLFYWSHNACHIVFLCTVTLTLVVCFFVLC